MPSLKVGWGPSSGARKIIYGKKSCKNFSTIGVTNLREFKKRFRARSGEHETLKKLVVPATHGDGEPTKTLNACYVIDIMHYFDNPEKTPFNYNGSNVGST